MGAEQLIASRLQAVRRRRAARPQLSIVVPAWNEADNLPTLAARVTATMTRVTNDYELIVVSDGSTDETCRVVTDLRRADRRIKLLHLSRNFGHQSALLAGLDHARGRVVITMDADLQHPPEAIPDMVAAWEAGADVVHGVRIGSPDTSPIVRGCKRAAYAALRRLCEVEIVPQSADFRLFDRRAVAALRRLRERKRFNRGLARWIGFPQAVVRFTESRRHAGAAKYSLRGLLRLLTDGVFSLSSRPLQYMGAMGLAISMLACAGLLVVLAGHAFGWPQFRAIAGWASIVAIMLLVNGIQLGGMWLMGQYLGRTYDEVKRRPSYVVAEALGVRGASASDAEPLPRHLRRHRHGAASEPAAEDTTDVGIFDLETIPRDLMPTS